MKQFQKIRVKKPDSSVFDLSHEKKLTLNMGELVPVFLSEVLPGDKFRVNMEALIRMQPLQTPIMHRVNVFTHFFFVPNRIIWEDFEDFITGGRTGKDEDQPNFPKFTGTFDEVLSIRQEGDLADHLGIPIVEQMGGNEEHPPISQLPFRAYFQIYNDYYRDPTLMDEIDISRGSEDFAITNVKPFFELRKRCWEKDYFTSALPFAQRGDQVLLPLGDKAPITPMKDWEIVRTAYPSQPYNGNVEAKDGRLSADEGAGSTLETSNTLEADLSQASSATINDLRTSFAVQRWLEKSARGGYRYVEQLLHRFGVKSSDARLQRAEYLGGGKMPIRISEVLQMSQTDSTPQGNMAGHGVTAGITAGFKKRFEEHGFVIGIMSILPRTAYYQGIPKIFSKFDRFDYFFPEFAHIGEQPVYNQELYIDSDSDKNKEVFGYQERYAEYRTMPDTVSGNMRTDLDFWHMARKFVLPPSLNSGFVRANPTTRIWPLDSQNPEVNEKFAKIICQTYCDFKAIRPVPKFGQPI